MDEFKIKAIAKELGADICGIARVGRFKDSPHGFSPLDIYSKSKSVIVFAKRVPAKVLSAENCIPYTHVSEVIVGEVDSLGVKALDGVTVNQKLCRVLSNFVTERECVLKKCHSCRSVCPHVFGIREKIIGLK